MTEWTCATCKALDMPGYCAPKRCYCGHLTCHAYASWLNPVDDRGRPILTVADARHKAAEKNTRKDQE